jgi:magnesium-dependent phosphatase-1
VDVASCRKHSFKDRTEILNMMTRLQGYNTKKKDFLGDLIWQEVAFNTTAYGTSKIAIASCCDEPLWARQILQKFRIFDPFEHGFKKTLAEASESEQLVQIRHETKKARHVELRQASGIPFDQMLFFDDHKGNIRNVSSLDVPSTQTPGDDGVSWKTFVS